VFAELKLWPTYLNQSKCNLMQRRTVLHVSPHCDVAVADAQFHCNDVEYIVSAQVLLMF
jgi:hypothetical protein